MDEHDHDHEADTVEEPISFWDRTPDQLNWFGKFLFWVRNFFVKKG